MSKVLFVGLDVHAETIAVAVLHSNGYWTAAPMTAQAHEKENPPHLLCGMGSGTNPRV
jgi:hypothetical protein